MVAAIAESIAAIVIDRMATTSTSTTTVPDTLNVLDIGCGDCSSGRALVSAIGSSVSRLTHTTQLLHVDTWVNGRAQCTNTTPLNMPPYGQYLKLDWRFRHPQTLFNLGQLDNL
jgi:hypothetical protein